MRSGACQRNPFRHGLRERYPGPVSQHRPLFFFGVTGRRSPAGIILSLIVIDRYNQYQTLAVGYALISARWRSSASRPCLPIIPHSIRASSRGSAPALTAADAAMPTITLRHVSKVFPVRPTTPLSSALSAWRRPWTCWRWMTCR